MAVILCRNSEITSLIVTMIVPWQVGMYPHHGGDNQVWRLEEGGLISTQLDPALVLVVGEGGAVVLGQRAGAGQSWGAGEGGLLRWGDTGLVLTQQCGGGVGAAPPREECPHQSWDLVPAADMDTAATPATSCHLRYPLPGDVSPHVSTCQCCRLQTRWTRVRTGSCAARSPSRPPPPPPTSAWWAGARPDTRASRRSRRTGRSPPELTTAD